MTIKFNPNNNANLTYGECLDPTTKVTTQVVEADSYDEAYEKARLKTEELDLSSKDDESDDEGELTDAESIDEE